jgi:hypothetical protein
MHYINFLFFDLKLRKIDTFRMHATNINTFNLSINYL